MAGPEAASLNSSEASPEKAPHTEKGEKKDIEAGAGGTTTATHFDSADEAVAALNAEDASHAIKHRTLSWQKAAVLLFGEYVCLAIMSQAWSYSVLGYVPGLLVTFGMGLITLYTSYILWRFVMAQTAKGERCLDICDVGYLLFGKSRVAYEVTAIMLLLNNIFLMGFHVLTGAEILNTLSDHSRCTVIFSVIITLSAILLSTPRTLNHVSLMSWVSAFFMALAILLCMIFAGIEDNPLQGYGGEYPTLGEVTSRAFPVKGTTFVAGMGGFLNITFLWIGQILYPTFIAEMRQPQDFPKALIALTIAEFALFSIPAIVGYRYLGQYTYAPAFGSLQTTYKKASFSFVIIPTLVIGVIYAHVVAKYVFSRLLGKTRHAHSHTVTGWGTWIGINIVQWFLAFCIGSIIPSFGDFLSIMSAAFDSSYGAIYWVIAYWHLNRGQFWTSPLKSAESVLNIFILIIGLFMLGPGLYASIQAIIDDYSGPVKHPFSCANNAL